MAKFKVKDAVRGETNHSMFGTIPYKFAKGEVTPKSEEEEIALRGLVSAGLATVAQEDTPSEEE